MFDLLFLFFSVKEKNIVDVNVKTFLNEWQSESIFKIRIYLNKKSYYKQISCYALNRLVFFGIFVLVVNFCVNSEPKIYYDKCYLICENKAYLIVNMVKVSVIYFMMDLQ